MPEEKNPLITAQEILIDAREAVDKLLVNNDMLRVSITTKLSMMINNLGFISGKPVAGLTPKSPLRPMTEFMGEPLKKKPTKVTTETLTPDEQRKKDFADKVDKLESNFANLSNEQILDSHKDNDLPIRGVARKAGLEKYKKNEIPIVTPSFLDEIRTALAAQKEFNQNKLKIGAEFNEDQDQQ